MACFAHHRPNHGCKLRTCITPKIDVRGAGAELKAVPVKDTNQVTSIIEKFRAKYGAGDVKKYYSKLDVAVVAGLPSSAV